MRPYVPYDKNNFSHPVDMRRILEYLREHGDVRVPASEIEELYSEFSASRSVQWLVATDRNVREFAEWLADCEDDEED